MPGRTRKREIHFRSCGIGTAPVAIVVLLSSALVLQGCFDPVYPQVDRDARVLEALDAADTRDAPPSPLTAAGAVSYALTHSLDARVAELDAEYQDASRVAAKRRLLPSLTARYSLNHANHPGARWSESSISGNQSLESSYSSEQTTRQSEIGAMWNILDFGVGYLRARQQGERVRHSGQQRRRVRQQVVLDVLSQYWRAAAAAAIAGEAEALASELEKQGSAVRDSVELRILSGAEGARRELAVHSGLAELEQYRRAAAQAKLELAKVMGCGGAAELILSGDVRDKADIPDYPGGVPRALQAAALKRRPELFQQDAQERIAVDEARLALLQMAPNANLSLNLIHDPDKFLEWSNWMTVGARVSWNLFNIPARMAERRMAKLQGEMARKKGLALAAAVMAQVGMAFSDWRLGRDYAEKLDTRAAARERLVEALAAGEQDGQTRPGEVLQERVRLLSEKAAALRAMAEVRVAGARLANAVGLDPDDAGNLVWRFDDEAGEPPGSALDEKAAAVLEADLEAEKLFPAAISGLKVVKAEDFVAPAEYFEKPAAVGVRSAQEKSPDVFGPSAGENSEIDSVLTMTPSRSDAVSDAGKPPRTAFVDNFASPAEEALPEPVPLDRYEQHVSSSAGSLPFSLARVDAGLAERSKARERALLPLSALEPLPEPESAMSLRPPQREAGPPPASLKPPGR